MMRLMWGLTTRLVDGQAVAQPGTQCHPSPASLSFPIYEMGSGLNDLVR